MNKFGFYLLTVMVMTVVFPFPAAASASMQEEITHLLNYIESSDCVFIRNDNRYDQEEAVKHIEQKYNYIKKQIASTEDFIDGAATKSSMSGRPYTVICDGVELATAAWLRNELQKYRLK